jgi:hypothetical protein
MQQQSGWRALAVAGLLLAAGVGCRRKAEVSATGVSAWEPDRALLGQLAPEATFPDFRLRPPQGYQPARQTQGTNEGYLWAGPPHPDGTRPVLIVGVHKPPSPQAPMPTLEQALQAGVDSVRQRRQQFSSMPPERGAINGLPFLRARFTGVEPRIGKRVTGAVYVSVDGRRIFQLNTQDVEPYHQATAPLRESSLLTFKKR